MTDHEQSHHRPHGHHHTKDSSPDEARQHRQAESQAQPFVDDCAPEREEMRSAIHALETELAAAKADTLRAMADFQNLQ